MRVTSFKDFKKVARPGVRVPLVGEMVMDLDTPVSLYRIFEKEKFRFLLESVEGGEKWGRYSFVGLYPSVLFKSFGKKVEVIEQGKKKIYESSDPLGSLKEILHRYPFVSVPNLPPLPGGAVGLVSYDMVRFFEKLPDRGRPGLEVPDLYFMIPQILLVADGFEQTLKIIYDARIEPGSSLKKEYDKGCSFLKKVERLIERGERGRPRKKQKAVTLKSPRWKVSLSPKDHERGIARIREYIAAGDITQAVFSVRFQAPLKVDDLILYRTLRRINPSPYMFHLKFEDMSLVAASPEMMVRLQEGEMILRPIAGTRPRGKTEADDQALEKELLESEKERAEHVMLVDLGRNDLGRVAKPGSVRVDELMIIERYSHVMHIVSNIRARLSENKDAFDVLRATFPAGTLSGSPKVRAMEIIEELEPVRRAHYGGCVGYFGFSGNMEMAITIRTALLKDGQITVQAGGGIVADSNAAEEYQEIVNKSKAVMTAIEMVCRGE